MEHSPSSKKRPPLAEIPERTWILCMFRIPAALIGITLAGSFIAAAFADDEPGGTALALVALFVTPFATGLIAAFAGGFDTRERPWVRLVLIAASFGMAAVMTVGGFFIWIVSAGIACGDAYECPF